METLSTVLQALELLLLLREPLAGGPGVVFRRRSAFSRASYKYVLSMCVEKLQEGLKKRYFFCVLKISPGLVGNSARFLCETFLFISAPLTLLSGRVSVTFREGGCASAGRCLHGPCAGVSRHADVLTRPEHSRRTSSRCCCYDID